MVIKVYNMKTPCGGGAAQCLNSGGGHMNIHR